MLQKPSLSSVKAEYKLNLSVVEGSFFFALELKKSSLNQIFWFQTEAWVILKKKNPSIRTTETRFYELARLNTPPKPLFFH